MLANDAGRVTTETCVLAWWQNLARNFESGSARRRLIRAVGFFSVTQTFCIRARDMFGVRLPAKVRRVRKERKGVRKYQVPSTKALHRRLPCKNLAKTTMKTVIIHLLIFFIPT